jgi:hypothetical protein
VSLVVVPLTLAGAFLPLPLLLDAAHTIMTWCMGPLEWLSELPLAMLESHAPAGWTVAAAVAGVAWLLAPRGVPMRACGPCGWRRCSRCSAIAGAGEAWLDVLDVGQGSPSSCARPVTRSFMTPALRGAPIPIAAAAWCVAVPAGRGRGAARRPGGFARG